MITPRQKQKNKNKGPARLPPGNVVFEARRNAVALTGELNRAVAALRHSNACAVYLLGLVDGTVRIPLEDYKRLMADDDTTVAIAYENNEAVVSLKAPTAPVARTTHFEPMPDIGDTRPVGNVTVKATAVEPSQK